MIRPIRSVGNALGRIPPRWQFALFLTVTIAVSLALTVLSYVLYVISGTAQLDLSRPGYKQALQEVAPVDTNNYTFSGSGALDKKALSEFKSKYDSLINKTNGYGAFDPNALSDEQLNIGGMSTVIGPQ